MEKLQNNLPETSFASLAVRLSVLISILSVMGILVFDKLLIGEAEYTSADKLVHDLIDRGEITEEGYRALLSQVVFTDDAVVLPGGNILGDAVSISFKDSSANAHYDTITLIPGRDNDANVILSDETGYYFKLPTPIDIANAMNSIGDKKVNVFTIKLSEAKISGREVLDNFPAVAFDPSILVDQQAEYLLNCTDAVSRTFDLDDTSAVTSDRFARGVIQLNNGHRIGGELVQKQGVATSPAKIDSGEKLLAEKCQFES